MILLDKLEIILTKIKSTDKQISLLSTDNKNINDLKNNLIDEEYVRKELQKL